MDYKETASKLEFDVNEYHGCLTGNCPHSNQTECDAALKEHWKSAYLQLLEAANEFAKAAIGIVDEWGSDGSKDWPAMKRMVDALEKFEAFKKAGGK